MKPRPAPSAVKTCTEKARARRCGVRGAFLRAETGLKMIPGEIRDLGITYQADVLTVRPGALSQHLDASFRRRSAADADVRLAAQRVRSSM